MMERRMMELKEGWMDDGTKEGSMDKLKEGWMMEGRMGGNPLQDSLE